jgi:hypothetical protein
MPGAFAIESRRMCHPSFLRKRGAIASMLMVSNIGGRDQHRTGRFKLVSSAITAQHANTAHAGPGARLRCRVGDRRPQLIEDIKATPLQPGIEEIRIPSERAFRSRERALREGLNIDRLVFDSLVALRARPR